MQTTIFCVHSFIPALVILNQVWVDLLPASGVVESVVIEGKLEPIKKNQKNYTVLFFVILSIRY